MKTFHDTEFDIVLVKSGGIALFILALARLPSAIGAIFQIIPAIIYWQWSADDGLGGNMMQEMNVKLISLSLGQMISFAVLLLLAKWVFGYPKILRKWLKRSEEASDEA